MILLLVSNTGIVLKVLQARGNSFLLREGKWTFFFFFVNKRCNHGDSFGRIWWPLKRPGVLSGSDAPSSLLVDHPSAVRGRSALLDPMVSQEWHWVLQGAAAAGKKSHWVLEGAAAAAGKADTAAGVGGAAAGAGDGAAAGDVVPGSGTGVHDGSPDVAMAAAAAAGNGFPGSGAGDTATMGPWLAAVGPLLQGTVLLHQAGSAAVAAGAVEGSSCACPPSGIPPSAGAGADESHPGGRLPTAEHP